MPFLPYSFPRSQDLGQNVIKIIKLFDNCEIRLPSTETINQITMRKKLHKVHDAFVKNLLSHKESASEFIKNALPADVCQHFDLDKIIYLPDTYVPKELNEYISDIVLKVPALGSKGDITVSILVEHKSSVDHFTCLQLLNYIINGYNLQHKQKEQFSVIVPVIYYHGRGKWKFRPLDQLFADLPDVFRKYIPVFDIEMFKVQDYSVAAIHNIAEARLRAALMVQKGQYDNLVAIMDYVHVINSLESEEPGNFSYTLFVYLSNIPTFEPETIIEITNQLTTDMKTKSMTYSDYLRAEGSMEKAYAFARKLLLRNMPLEEICELTDLSMEEVKKLDLGPKT